jgi:hypothetical protein
MLVSSLLFFYSICFLFIFYYVQLFFLKKIMTRRKLGNVFCLQLLEGGEYEGEDLVPFYSPEDLLSVYPHQFYQVP